MASPIWSLAISLALLVARAPAQDPADEQPQESGGLPGQDPLPSPPGSEPVTLPQAPAVPPTRVQTTESPKVDVEDIAKRAAEGTPDEPSIAVTWQERLARDKHITFSARSATDASAALDRLGGTALHRAAAWMTLGCAGSPADRSRIAGSARGGKGLERRTAILALGEILSDETALLTSIATETETDAPAAECALLALLRSRRPSAHDHVDAIARDASDPRSAAAAALLAFHRNLSPEASPRAARTLIDLRWEAARAFGGVDGQSFTTRRIAELASSPTFRSDVVLRAAAQLPGAAPKDHLLSTLLEGTGNARLLAAVEAWPRALSRLVDSGLWTPGDAGEWSVLLTEIEREKAELSCLELLSRAEELPELRWKARALLARADRIDIASFGSIDLAALGAKDRALACQVLGSMADPAARALLLRLVDDPMPAVRGAALIGRLRQGDKSAAAALDPILEDRTRPEHAAVLESLCLNAREPAIAFRLETWMRKAVGVDLATVAAALCTQNRTLGRAVVRSLLSLDLPPTGPRRLMLVRALCRQPTGQDLQVLTQLFPQPGEEELNRELAVGLTLLSDPAVHPILRSALWHSGFDPGVLAGMLLVEEGGVRGLIDEIESPPPEAGPVDLRRAGFALGEWGGIEALRALVQENGSTANPEVQGALLGVLGARTQ